jgi:hypothetical protein
LARWVVKPDNPLTARVWVNRLSQHHFDKAIVGTPENFGRSGSPPTHPELLDWLAIRLAQEGWSTKAMQRLIMTSSVYRQSSKVTPLEERLDPHNVLLSRMPLIRMDAETLRDSLLFVSGRLDETRYGPPDLLYVGDDGLVNTPETNKGWRRTIYTLQNRQRVLTALDLFDYPTFMTRNSLTPNCTKRANTAVATQSLYLLNDPEIRKLADYLAERVWEDVSSDPTKQIERVYWLALGRPPTAEEKDVVLTTLQSAYQSRLGQPAATKQVLARFCLTIMNSGSFVFVN